MFLEAVTATFEDRGLILKPRNPSRLDPRSRLVLQAVGGSYTCVCAAQRNTSATGFPHTHGVVAAETVFKQETSDEVGCRCPTRLRRSDTCTYTTDSKYKTSLIDGFSGCQHLAELATGPLVSVGIHSISFRFSSCLSLLWVCQGVLTVSSFRSHCRTAREPRTTQATVRTHSAGRTDQKSTPRVCARRRYEDTQIH